MRALGCRLCEGSPTPRLDSQSKPCAKKEWEIVDVCGLHKPEQDMLEGSFPSPTNRLGHGPQCRVQTLEFPRCLLGLPPDTPRRVDQLATTFITPFRCFCYIKLQFRLKNAGATYKQCLQSCFKGQIGHNLEVYVDDIIIKIW
jgi:hypothetical protein